MTRLPISATLVVSGFGLLAAVILPRSCAGAASRPAEPVLGYINHVPPESASARRERHVKVARRRANLPIIVHRGARDVAPENTLEAYAAAMGYGADGCEVDIRRSKDGVLYLHHDDDLGRTVEGAGKISDLTYYEIVSKPMKIYGSANRHTHVPTLAAFLALAGTRAMLIHLDVKEPGLEDDIARLIDEADMWDHIVEVNVRNGESLRSSPKVQLMGYKGWFPQGADSNNPAAIREFLAQSGAMMITVDPRPAVRALGREAVTPERLPDNLRALWSHLGIVQTQPASAPSR